MSWCKQKHCNVNVKGVDYRCIFGGISKNEAVNILNNSVLKGKGVL